MCMSLPHRQPAIYNQDNTQCFYHNDVCSFNTDNWASSSASLETLAVLMT